MFTIERAKSAKSVDSRTLRSSIVLLELTSAGIKFIQVDNSAIVSRRYTTKNLHHT